MIDPSEKLKAIKDTLEGMNIDLGDKLFDEIRSALSILKEVVPGDARQVYTMEQRLISISDEISYAMMIINKQRLDMENRLRNGMKGEVTMLTRQGRPSMESIKMEIFWKHEELSELNDNLQFIINLINYLNSIRESLNQYVFLLRDISKANY